MSALPVPPLPGPDGWAEWATTLVREFERALVNPKLLRVLVPREAFYGLPPGATRALTEAMRAAGLRFELAGRCYEVVRR